MAEIRFTHPDKNVVPWEKGAIVVLQIREVTKNGYITDTLETFPADIQQQHAAQLALVGKQFVERGELLAEALRQNEALVGRVNVKVPMRADA